MLVFLHTGFDFVVGCELISDHCPILHLAPVPFFVEFGNSEIEQFKERIFVREGTFFGDFSETGIDTLDSICSVHNLTNSAAVIEKLLNMAEVSFSYINCTGILRPLVTELFKCFSGSYKARYAMYLL